MADKTRMTLIQRLQQPGRNDQCWEDFVGTYAGYIYVIIRNFNLSKDLCDDLLQDVLLKLWKDLLRFEYRPGECRFRTWLSVVSCNTVKDYLKSRAGCNSKKELEYEAALHGMNSFSEPEIEAIAEREWKVYVAKKAYKNIKDSLSEKVRLVFELDLEDVADEEISRRLGIAESSVRVYKKRARNALLKEVLRLNKELEA